MSSAAEADYVIIGAGSAGCALAARLSEEPDRTVLLLEAGGRNDHALIRAPAGFAAMLPWPISNWHFKTLPQPGLNGRKGYQPRGKGLGGSSAINAMVYMRGRPGDYDGWKMPGWSWEEVRPAFEAMETGGLAVSGQQQPFAATKLFLEACEQAGIAVCDDFDGRAEPAAGLNKVTIRDGERCTSAAAFLLPAWARPNLTVLTGARAGRIVMQGGRATGVRYYKDKAWQEARAAREVILCAGVFQTPQLLMLSGIGPAAPLAAHGITAVAELPGVGSNLQDHIDYVLVHTARPGRDTIGMSGAGGRTIWQAIMNWRRNRRGHLTSPIAEASAFVKTDRDLATPDLQLVFAPGIVLDHGRRMRPGHGVSVHVSLLTPRSRGLVTLASADPLAAPAIDPQYLTHAEDVTRLVNGLRQARGLLRSGAFAPLELKELHTAEVDDDAGLAQWVRRRADTIYHPVGTCRMGAPGDPMAVVDASLKVYGVDGLRVADASVMPSIPSVNTNAAATMIGWRAADLIT